MFGVTILGSNSAIPAHDRNPTAQIVTLQGELILIDCGEGTQFQIEKFKIKKSKINYILISHLHGDHYFGLMGLLNSFSLSNRLSPIKLVAPIQLKAIIDIQLKAANSNFSFPLEFYPLEETTYLEAPLFSISCFKVSHSIDCWGFVIKEKLNPRKIDIQAVQAHKVPHTFYTNLQQGEDYYNEQNEKIENSLLTLPNRHSLAYAYSADTKFYPPIIECVEGADLFYHETTYLAIDKEKAAQRFHSTTIEAGWIAKEARVKRLLIGHYSSRYKKLQPFLEEVCTVFEDSFLAKEGVTYLVTP